MEKSPQVDLLSAISVEVEPILAEVRKEYEKDYEFTNQIFVLRTEKVKDKLEVILSVYDVSDFKNCFEAILFPLYGLYEYNSNSVLVYGDDSQELFKKQGGQELLDLLKCEKNKIEESESDIPYPPVVFEPIVWIYTGTSKNLAFKEQSQFNVIE